MITESCLSNLPSLNVSTSCISSDWSVHKTRENWRFANFLFKNIEKKVVRSMIESLDNSPLTVLPDQIRLLKGLSLSLSVKWLLLCM